MKSLFTSILLILCFSPLFSQQMQRMITDYRGVTSNGNNILCYGDYGIITYTLDYGKTWKQLTLGDKHSIKSIKTIGNNFIGATDYSLIKSTTNGLTWIRKDISASPRIIDLALVNTTMYLLTPTGVFLADSDLNLSNIPLLALDSSAEYSEIATDGKDMYIIFNKKYLIHYALDTKQLDTTNLVNVIAPTCGDCTNLVDLKSSGNTVYVSVNNVVNDGYRHHLVAKSDTKGKTWRTLSAGYIVTNGCYEIDKGDVYVMRTKLLYYNTSRLIGPEYIKIDTSKFVVDTLDFTVINDKDGIDRTIYSTNTDKSSFNEVITINTDTLIAVGSHKMISMSYNGGKSWEMKSYFKGVFEENDYQSYLSDNIGYIVNRLVFYRTLDGGITWLPQKFKLYPQFAGLSPTASYFNSTGQGYIKFVTRNIADTNILVTNDFGDNYTLLYKDSLSHYSYENNPSFSNQYRMGLDLGDYVLFLGHHSKSDNYTLLRYDKNFQLVDTVEIKSKSILTMTVTKNSSIICLCMNTSGENKADSLGNTKNYTYNYYLLKSTDKGKTWDSVQTNVPIYQTLRTNDKINYFYENVMNLGYNTHGVAEDNFILYPSYSQFNSNLGYNLIYRYNYLNDKFDSLKIPTQLSFNKNTIFHFGASLFAVSRHNNLYYTYADNIGNKTVPWDSLITSNIFNGWDGYYALIPQDNKDAILSASMFTDTSGFLIIGTSGSGIIGRQFKINLVKLTLSPEIVNVDEPKIEENRAFLWNFAPYPMPGKNMIRSDIYWNRTYNINDAKVNVYDMYGVNLESKDIVIQKVLDYKGILEWDCSGVASGVYVIQIILAGESHSFPVMVWK